MVFQFTFKKNNVQHVCAYKSLNSVHRKEDWKRDFRVHYFINEVAILKNLSHDNIIKYYGVFLEPNLALITEWCVGPDLWQYLRFKHINTLYNMEILTDIAYQVSDAVEYLHVREILHRDIKSMNVFLTKKVCPDKYWIAKLGDYGLSLSYDYGFWLATNDVQEYYKIGTFEW
jgi:serine/threonine protein kinase